MEERHRRYAAWVVAVFCVVIVGLFAVPFIVGSSAPAAEPYVRPTDAFDPPATPAAASPVALFIGDSYSAGAGASAPALRWTTLASGELGWVESNHALGGTGYVKTSGVEGCGLDYCGTYGEVIDGIEGVAPNIVVISGGRNDGPVDDHQATVEATIRSAQSQWPAAQIIVSSPVWDDDAAPQWLAASIATVRAAASATGATFVDLGQPLAGRSDLLVEDGVHPNDAGYAALAATFTSAVGPTQ